MTQETITTETPYPGGNSTIQPHYKVKDVHSQNWTTGPQSVSVDVGLNVIPVIDILIFEQIVPLQTVTFRFG